MGGGGVSMSKVDASSWKKFKISDLFTAETGDVDLQQKDVNGKGVALVSSGESNTGVIGLTDVPAKVILGNTITVDMFGSVQYRDFEYKMVTHARVFALVPKEPINQETGLFLATLLQKLTGCFSYNNMCSWNKIKDFEISLPVTAAERPDWDYMQERIAELEQERIAELEQYLVATGLNDYTLTDEDLKTLSLSGFWSNEAGNCQAAPEVRKEMREFRMDSIVDVLTPKQKYNANAVSIDNDGKSGYPYVVRQSDNNGIRGYIDEAVDTLNPARTFSFGQDTATVFWQTSPYFTGDKIKVLAPKYDLTDEMAQYIMSGIRRAFSNFSWGQQSFSEKVIKAVEVTLPIQTDVTGQPVIDKAKIYHPDGFVPDWDYMTAYIRAIEKLVIKDVVDFKDAFISKAKEAVGV